MSQAPSMPMYWDAYLADTTHLSTEEHGAYLLLLAAMWRRNGSVPDDDADNSRILGLTKAKWRKVKVRLSDFLIISDGMISQKKLQETWKNTQEKIEKNRANGAKGGRAAASKNNDLGQANAANSLKPNSSIPEPEPEPDKEATASLPASAESKDLYQDFLSKHPRPRETPMGEKHFDEAIAGGASAAEIIAAAAAYSVEVKGYSDQNFTAYSDNWLRDQKWKLHTIKPAKAKPTEEEIDAFNAKTIKSGHSFLLANFSAERARRLIGKALVTEAECRAVGIAI